MKKTTENSLSVGLFAVCRVQDILVPWLALKSLVQEVVVPVEHLQLQLRQKCPMWLGCVWVRFYTTAQKWYVISLKKHVYNSLLIAKLESQKPDTLSEIIHRQTPYGHLIIIDDCLFALFEEFDKRIYPYLNVETLTKYQRNFFSSVFSSAMDSMFVDNDICCPSDITHTVLYAPFCKYLRVSMKELGLRIMEQQKANKKLAHRKQVLLEEAAAVLHPAKRPKLSSCDTSPFTDISHHQDVCEASTSAEISAEQNVENFCSKCNGKFIEGTS